MTNSFDLQVGPRRHLSIGRLLQIVIDVSILAGALVIAYLLRFDFALPAEVAYGLMLQIPYVVALQVLAMVGFGIYSFVWRYIGMAEIRSFLGAAIASLAPILVIRLLIPAAGDLRVPLSVAVMDTVLGFGGVLAVRVLRRAVYERAERGMRAAGRGAGAAILLIGAGQAGVLAAREILGRGDTGLCVKGFVDDDPSKRSTLINGVRVLGRTEDLPRLVRELSIDHVVITIARATRADIRRIIAICAAIPVRARIVPTLYEILHGNVEISRIRNVEIEDLLGREAVKFDESDTARLVASKVVLVSGAGGSIGSELARQVALFQPSRLLLLDRAEFALFEIDRELRQKYPQMQIEPVVADLCDESRIRSVFARYRPTVIVHAAAHKHVPMMELHPAEAVKNNVFGTQTLARAAADSSAEAFVLISTDKAVNPTSVMGASKRVAELVVQDLAKRSRTRFLAVRFGNVMGSTGSVIPIFKKQIESGGPVTVTHPDMTRYFMTIPEAAQLVLEAAAIGAGGEIFILDMGEPVRIVDMAVQMIRLSGCEDIAITFTGIRPGEKLYEELGHDTESMSRTLHPKIFIGNLAAYDTLELAQHVKRLGQAAAAGDDAGIRCLLKGMLPESQIAVEDEPPAGSADEIASAATPVPSLHISRAAEPKALPGSGVRRVLP